MREPGPALVQLFAHGCGNIENVLSIQTGPILPSSTCSFARIVSLRTVQFSRQPS